MNVEVLRYDIHQSKPVLSRITWRYPFLNLFNHLFASLFLPCDQSPPEYFVACDNGYSILNSLHVGHLEILSCE